MNNIHETLEKKLNDWINATSESGNELHQAAKYMLFPGGKRLRPLLCVYSALDLGCDLERILDPACALELIHTYSLIHDDLPCMDNDNFRRGKPTLHKAYSESTALLTGDYFLTLAFDILSHANQLQAQEKIQLIQTLAQAIGGKGMIQGQYLDLAYETKKIPLSRIYEMHKKKTGELFSACFHFAAILGNADKRQTELLCSIGTKFGLAYQLLDDIQDQGSDKISQKAPKPNTQSLHTMIDLFHQIQNLAKNFQENGKVQKLLEKIISENSSCLMSFQL